MPEQRLHNKEKNNIDNITKITSFLTLSASTEFIIIYLAFQKGFDNVTHEDHKENTIVTTGRWSHDLKQAKEPKVKCTNEKTLWQEKC